MKKLNNKGVTLVELIVSFAIVAVAIIYFFQTLYTVKDLYSQGMNETNEYVMKDYGLRMADAILENGYNLSTKAIFDYNVTKDGGWKGRVSCSDDKTGIECCKNVDSDYKKGVKTKLYKYDEDEIKSYTIYVCR